MKNRNKFVIVFVICFVAILSTFLYIEYSGIMQDASADSDKVIRVDMRNTLARMEPDFDIFAMKWDNFRMVEWDSQCPFDTAKLNKTMLASSQHNNKAFQDFVDVFIGNLGDRVIINKCISLQTVTIDYYYCPKYFPKEGCTKLAVFPRENIESIATDYGFLGLDIFMAAFFSAVFAYVVVMPDYRQRKSGSQPRITDYCK
jgi:hypothetical protein